jgi:hypothetical protein
MKLISSSLDSDDDLQPLCPAVNPVTISSNEDDGDELMTTTITIPSSSSSHSSTLKPTPLQVHHHHNAVMQTGTATIVLPTVVTAANRQAAKQVRKEARVKKGYLKTGDRRDDKFKKKVIIFNFLPISKLNRVQFDAF